MTNAQWSARLVATVLGVPAVMAVGLIAFVWLVLGLVRAEAPTWLRLVMFAPFAFVPVAVSWRLIRGGEQGPTNVEMIQTLAERRMTISNVPLFDVARAVAQVMGAFRRAPLPRPVGRVVGSPAIASAVVPDPTATLPEGTPVAEESPALPEDAAGVRGADQSNAIEIPEHRQINPG